MISFVYFDVGGVLLDWSNVFGGAARKFKIDSENIGKIFDENHDDITKGIMTADDFWQKCVQKYGLKDASDFDFLDSWVSDYRPIKATHEALKKIKAKCKVGLLSNIYKDMLPLLVKKGIIPDITYDQIVFSCDVGTMKPEAAIYELAQKKAGVRPEEILLVDDRLDYIDGAKKTGWQTFLYDTKDYERSSKELIDYLDKAI